MGGKKRSASSEKDRPKLSVCMIVKNEEAVLERCLASIKPVADEIIIVDTGSTDRTMEIARKFDAKIYEHPWQKNFSLHRNQSLSYATGDWILQIDADEELDPQSQQVLLETIKNAPADVNGFAVVIKDYRQNGLHGASFNYPRLYRNRIGVHYKGIVHNRVVIPGTVEFSKIVINHYGYDLGPREMLRKFKRSASLLRKMIRENPKDPLPYFYLTNMYSYHQKHEKCIAYALKTLELLRQVGRAADFFLGVYHALIVALIALKRYDEAEKHALESLQVKDDYLDSYYHLSSISYIKRKFHDCVKYGEKYLELAEIYENDPSTFNTFTVYMLNRKFRLNYFYGVALVAIGRVKEGLEAIDWALNHPFGKIDLAIECAHNLLAVTRDHKPGYQVYKKIYEKFSEDGGFILSMACDLAEIDHLGWLSDFISEFGPPGTLNIESPRWEMFLHMLRRDTRAISELLRNTSADDPAIKPIWELLSTVMKFSGQSASLTLAENPEFVIEFYSQLAGHLSTVQNNMNGTDGMNMHETSERMAQEKENIIHLANAVKAIFDDNSDILIHELAIVAENLDVRYPQHFEDVHQLLKLLIDVGTKADSLAFPDVGNLAFAIAAAFFGEDFQVRAILLKRQIDRSLHEGDFPLWVRPIFKFFSKPETGSNRKSSRRVKAEKALTGLHA